MCRPRPARTLRRAAEVSGGPALVPRHSGVATPSRSAYCLCRGNRFRELCRWALADPFVQRGGLLRRAAFAQAADGRGMSDLEHIISQNEREIQDLRMEVQRQAEDETAMVSLQVRFHPGLVCSRHHDSLDRFCGVALGPLSLATNLVFCEATRHLRRDHKSLTG